MFLFLFLYFKLSFLLFLFSLLFIVIKCFFSKRFSEEKRLLRFFIFYWIFSLLFLIFFYRLFILVLRLIFRISYKIFLWFLWFLINFISSVQLEIPLFDLFLLILFCILSLGINNSFIQLSASFWVLGLIFHLTKKRSKNFIIKRIINTFLINFNFTNIFETLFDRFFILKVNFYLIRLFLSLDNLNFLWFSLKWWSYFCKFYLLFRRDDGFLLDFRTLSFNLFYLLWFLLF